jgi:hypothetical protein
MRKKLKLSPDGGDSGSNKCKRGYGSAYCGVWRESGVRRSILSVAFGKNLASLATKMFFTFDLLNTEILYILYLNAIYKDNSEINCITVQDKKVLSPSTLTGHTRQVVV